MRVLLTNGESAKTLACMRALNDKRIEIFVTGYFKHSPAFYSKYCKKGVVISKPSIEHKFLNDIINIIKRKKIDVLIPVNSKETVLLSRHHNRINKICRFPFEKYEKMNQIGDKGNLMKIAKKLNIPIPRTLLINKTNSVNNISVNFPCVLKLSNSTSSKGVFYSNNKKELNDLLVKYKTQTKIIQEYIKGIGYGVSYLYDNGKMIAYFAHKRLREYPITGGPSTFREGVKDEKLIKLGKKILDYVKWDGLAMVEFKKCKEGYRLIEINPRIWGSINQAILSGVNFPYLLLQKALNKRLKIEMGNYKTNIKTKLYLNDIRSILASIKNRKYPLWKIFEIFDFRNSDELSRKDIVPFIYYFYHALKYKMN